MPDPWDHPDTARYYAAFCATHARYRDANLALGAAALLRPGMRVLDLAAGSGGTAEVACAAGCEVVCFEPARAMRAAGERGVAEARWTSVWPAVGGAFDRVLCGAAIWQLTPLAETFARVAALLEVGGAFVFNIPSLYLGEADLPGGGCDPLLVELPARLAVGRSPQAEAAPAPPDAEGMGLLLRAAGFEPWRWCMRARFTQEDLRDWMKIPVLTESLLGGMPADERAALVDGAYAECDGGSWRWEMWTGWTAWRR
ncbi:MAG: class I SAM-dependent methyltransferase [Candidatus Solibacter sp.]